MKLYGATVGVAIYVEAENEDEAAKKILAEARSKGLNEPWIIDMGEEDEFDPLEADEDY